MTQITAAAALNSALWQRAEGDVEMVITVFDFPLAVNAESIVKRKMSERHG